jgi:tetratricopeptide (TPR) repeat protein
VGDRLREYWDFDDLDATEQRLRTMLETESTDDGRAEVLTQLARVDGLAGRFDAGDRLLDEAALVGGSSVLVQARVELERGRLRRSAGDSEAAAPLFESAFASAMAIGHEFIAVDAAHMVAIAAQDEEERLAWTRRGIELAESSFDPEVTYWLGPLFNNLGWDRYEAAQYDAALEAFERALSERLKQPGKPAEIAIARYAVGRTLRELGRCDDAVGQLEQSVAWATEAGAPDGWFHEELALDLAALDRREDAAEQARRALPLLDDQDPSFTAEGERAARLRELARQA